MSARGILTKFVNEALRKQGKPIDGRIAEKVFQAFGVQTSRQKSWAWLAAEMGRQRGVTPVLPKPKRLRKIKARTAIVIGSSEDFYNSREWRTVRFDALKKANGCCVLCGRSHKADGVVLHVDHIKPRSKSPHLQLCRDNLQVLCRDCNLGKSNRDDTDWR